MSVKTGIFRIAQVIKWFGALVLAGFLIVGFVTGIEELWRGPFSTATTGRAIGEILAGALIGGALFVVCRAVSWVLEGFAKD
jgi:hypothetical protein